MLRGPGRIVVLLICVILAFYVLYNFMFGGDGINRTKLQDINKNPNYRESFHNERLQKVSDDFERVQRASPHETLDLEKDSSVIVKPGDVISGKQQQTAAGKKVINSMNGDQFMNRVKSSTAHFQVKPNADPIANLSVIGDVNLFEPRLFKSEMFYTKCDDKMAAKFHKLHRLVHLDFKGAPPNVSYFKELFPLLSKMGATGLLMEYEDKFPFSGELKDIAATNAYTSTQLKEILALARQNGLKTIIPLVQTFGHMSYVLKYEKYRDLRENDTTPQIIRPFHEKSLDLIMRIMNQVVDIHGDIEYLHIGADEVYQLGTGKVKDYMKQHNMSLLPHEIFFSHIKTIRQRALGGLKVLMWDDMFRRLPLEQIQNSGLAGLVEPMVWQYSVRPQETFPIDLWKNYRKVFGKVWAASSFKGATGSFKYVTDSTVHLSNHLNWIEIMKSQGIDDLFKGTVLTGWQRYDHFATLCEVLPVAVPTLALTLRSLDKGCFDARGHWQASDILKCKRNIEISLPIYWPKTKNISAAFTPGLCEFPGYKIYDDALKLHVLQQFYEQQSIQSRLKGWMNDYNIAMKYTNPGQMAVMTKFLDKLSEELNKLKKNVTKDLPEIFDAPTVNEWMTINFISLEKKINESRSNVLYLSSEKTWKRRALSVPLQRPPPLSKNSMEQYYRGKSLDGLDMIHQKADDRWRAQNPQQPAQIVNRDIKTVQKNSNNLGIDGLPHPQEPLNKDANNLGINGLPHPQEPLHKDVNNLGIDGLPHPQQPLHKDVNNLSITGLPHPQQPLQKDVNNLGIDGLPRAQQPLHKDVNNLGIDGLPRAQQPLHKDVNNLGIDSLPHPQQPGTHQNSDPNKNQVIPQTLTGDQKKKDNLAQQNDKNMVGLLPGEVKNIGRDPTKLNAGDMKVKENLNYQPVVNINQRFVNNKSIQDQSVKNSEDKTWGKL